MTDRFLGCFFQKTLCVKMPYISIYVTRGEPCMPCMRSDLSHANVIGINLEGCVHPVACTCVMCAAWWEWNCLLVKHSIVGKYVYVVWWSVLVIPTCKKWRWLSLSWLGKKPCCFSTPSYFLFERELFLGFPSIPSLYRIYIHIK
jgi:hypothetical protein